MASKPAKQPILIFDTTLRDGEQSPGASMNISEKLRMAQALARLKVDVIEAGFPVASTGDFEAVHEIAKRIQGPIITGLARAQFADIDRAALAVKPAKRKRIHTFIATSPIHMKYKLKMNASQVLREAQKAVRRAKDHLPDVEFSAEDATRSDWAFLREIFEAVIEAGATTLNVPDTVGYTIPTEYFDLIKYLGETVRNINSVIISVHCHNDLGLAVANSLAAVKAGARQVECTINGIGERAGNASLEEIVMALRTRGDVMPFVTRINAKEIYPASRLLSNITGIQVQPNKAIVGANAFAHEAGIHQDGILKKTQTYEIMNPQDVGIAKNQLVLGKHSGRHAFGARLKKLGFDLIKEDLDRAFKKFKDLADKKKTVYDEDLEALVTEEIIRMPDRFKLVFLESASGNITIPSATVQMQVGEAMLKKAAFGTGPVDAAYKAIIEITGTKAKLVNYHLQATTQGEDAQGEVAVILEEKGIRVRGQGTDTDINVASALAYINALNRLEARKAKNDFVRKVPKHAGI